MPGRRPSKLGGGKKEKKGGCGCHSSLISFVAGYTYLLLVSFEQHRIVRFSSCGSGGGQSSPVVLLLLLWPEIVWSKACVRGVEV